MKTSSGFKLWKARLEGGVVTHAQAVQFANAIYPLAQGCWPRGHRSNVTALEAPALVIMMSRVCPVVVERDAARGRKWLVGYHRRLGMPDLDYGSAGEFRFVDVYEHAEQFWQGNTLLTCGPVYRTALGDGTVVKYAPAPWQRAAFGHAHAEQMWFEIEREEIGA